MNFKRVFSQATSAAVLCMLVACGVPATGTSSTTPTAVGMTEPAGTAVVPPPTVDTLPTADTTATSVPNVTDQNMTSTPETANTAQATVEPGATAGSATTDLDGTTWQLTEYGQEGAMETASGEVTIVFGPGDQISGNSGCNSYGGTYSYDGTTFSVSNVASTMVACVDNTLMQQEGVFTGGLNQATGLTIDGDTLTITYPGGMLRLTRTGGAAAASPLEGTTWNLESIVTGAGDSGTASSVVAGSTVTATWNNGTVNGSAGCNQYTANYTLADETLEVGDVVTTRMACDGPLMEQETAFVNAMDTATELRIEDGRLIVTHPDGQLVFTAAS